MVLRTDHVKVTEEEQKSFPDIVQKDPCLIYWRHELTGPEELHPGCLSTHPIPVLAISDIRSTRACLTTTTQPFKRNFCEWIFEVANTGLHKAGISLE